MQRKPKRGKTQSRTAIAIAAGVFGVFILLAGAAIVLLSSGNRGPQPVIPTVALLPSPTGRDMLPTVAPSTVTPTTGGVQRATLPPTWTLSPTPTVTPTPNASPTPQANSEDAVPTVWPTLNGALLPNTYWDGDGVDSMWDYQLADGSYGRFTIFPVNFWVGAYGNVAITAEMDQAINNAVSEINQVVPIQRVNNRLLAHMTLWLMDDTEFNQNASCEGIHMTIGCTSFGFSETGVMVAVVWLRVTDDQFPTTVLHELTHALGIPVHSPNPADIMYAYAQGQPPRYTQRDLNTILALYSAPPYSP